MEIFAECFCDLKDYKSVAKKMKVASSLSQMEVGKFVQFMRENGRKRKSSALSFEVN